jgi:nucleotide-binding universal stress UspA family protein
VTIGNVLLHAAAETVDAERGPAAYALGLAAAFRAHLTALVLEVDVYTPSSAYAPARALAAEARAAVEARNRGAAARAARLRERAARDGLSAEVVTDRSYAYGVPEVAADHARLHDVTVAGVDESGLLSERAVAEHVLFASGRPLIVVPGDREGGFACGRVVVAWDFGRAAARALADAAPFLARAAEVSVVTLADDKRVDTSLTGGHVVAALARRGVAARFEEVRRGSAAIGDALLGCARERNADLLVMGGYGHSRLRELVLGGATRGVLGSASLPVLMSH